MQSGWICIQKSQLYSIPRTIPYMWKELHTTQLRKKGIAIQTQDIFKARILQWAFLLSDCFSSPSLSRTQGNWKEMKISKSYALSGLQTISISMVQNKIKVLFKRTKHKYSVVKSKDNGVLSAWLLSWYLTCRLCFSLNLISLSVERRHTFPGYFIFQTVGFRSEKSPVHLAHWSSFHVLEATHWVFEFVAVRLKTNGLHICKRLKERNLNKYFKGWIK